MNFNANAGLRNPQGPIRKVKRVSDTNALGGAPIPNNSYMNMTPTYEPSASIHPVQQQQQQPEQFMQQQQQFNNQIPMMSSSMIGANYNNLPTAEQMNFGYSTNTAIPQQIEIPTTQYPNFSNSPSPQPQAPPQHYPQPQLSMNYGQQQPSSSNNLPPQFAMFQQPIVQDMAMQYGQKLADQGKQMMENQFEKWIPITQLKYYFAVDNKYVINKMRLLFFPFTHKDWSLKYDQENPVQPRYDINAPDLYIPTMAYISYVVLAGLMLGMQNRFTPEQLGIQASSALAYSIFELFIYLITLYIANIPTNLKTLDLVAFAGYKFVIIVACIAVSLLFYSSGYYIALIYCSLSLGFFLLRTLKTKVLNDSNAQTAPAGGINYDPYGAPLPPTAQQFDYSIGRKRKLYFLFLIVGIQAFLSFWLSKHLILHAPINLDSKMGNLPGGDKLL